MMLTTLLWVFFEISYFASTIFASVEYFTSSKICSPMDRSFLPRQRGNVSHQNLAVINAILYAENGCKWRALPKRFGNWHTIYTRMNRWAESGVLDRAFEKLQQEQLIRIKIESVSLDSTIVKVHPDGTGAFKKMDHKPSARVGADGAPKFIWLPRVLGAP